MFYKIRLRGGPDSPSGELQPVSAALSAGCFRSGRGPFPERFPPTISEPPTSRFRSAGIPLPDRRQAAPGASAGRFRSAHEPSYRFRCAHKPPSRFRCAHKPPSRFRCAHKPPSRFRCVYKPFPVHLRTASGAFSRRSAVRPRRDSCRPAAARFLRRFVTAARRPDARACGCTRCHAPRVVLCRTARLDAKLKKILQNPRYIRMKSSGKPTSADRTPVRDRHGTGPDANGKGPDYCGMKM